MDTTSVKEGEFYVDLVEEGEINATNAINISSPAMSWRFGMLKITQIVEDGAKVEAGDTVMMFDPSEVHKAIQDAEAQLEIARAELAKLKAQQASKIEELKANIRVSELSLQISEINLQQATYESDVTRKEIQLNLDKASIALDKAKKEVENQEKIHYQEVQQSTLKISQLEANLSEAEETLGRLTVVSPAPGIAIIRENWLTGNKWQVGDQPWSGNPMIDLPDLDELKVEAKISEVDISKVNLGLRAEIRLDAFSDTVYGGKVITVANLAQFKERDSKIKVFPVEVLIEGSSPVFLPGMTVSCRIIVDKVEDVLYIPLEALFTEGNEHYVFVKSGSTYDRKEIITSQKNNDYVIVREGLEKGQLIALADPFASNETTEGQP